MHLRKQELRSPVKEFCQTLRQAQEVREEMVEILVVIDSKIRTDCPRVQLEPVGIYRHVLGLAGGEAL